MPVNFQFLLTVLLEFIGPGDVLVCVKLDRLGRSTRDVLNLVHELDQKGAFLRILEPAISTDGPMGKMVLTVLGMVAEMELGFIKARQRDGIESAKCKGGVYKGRKPSIDPLVGGNYLMKELVQPKLPGVSR